MIITNLEEKLREYCRTQDNQLFENHLYEPFKAMAAFIATKYKVPAKDLPETINDMVSDAWLKLPMKYDSERGTAKCRLYIIMSQYLSNKMRYDNQQQRDRKMTLYIEDSPTEYESRLFEISIDNIEELKKRLLENKQVFDKLDKKIQVKIKNAILECIETPEKYTCEYNSYVKSIAKKTKSKLSEVYYTLDKMNKLVGDLVEI